MLGKSAKTSKEDDVFFEQFNTIWERLESDLLQADIEEDDILKKSEISVQLCLDAIGLLKKELKKAKFSTELVEIFFFKELKPKVVSWLIYHLEVYKLEMNRPTGSLKIKRKYLQIQLNKLKNFFDENLDFYRYYRTGSTYLDHKFFVRGKNDIRLQLPAHIFESNDLLCTSHDNLISKILAYDLLQVYLENELSKLDFHSVAKEVGISRKGQLQWTGNKAALIELMYALYESRSFNNGQTDIKAMAAYFEQIFDIELGHYYRTYLELKTRQNPTRFLDTLIDALNRRMDEDEK